MPQTPLERAIAVAGSESALAREIGVTSQAVSQWKRVPAERCPAVSRATGIALHDLRPDIYPAPTVALPPSEDRRTGEKAGLTPLQAEEAA
jgi:DNA-binding transcriptional regulator YdaS (Cro superfamily)